MNLKNNSITIGELLSNPKAKQILVREFPQYANHPLIGMAGYMPLSKVLNMASGKVPKDKLLRTIEELKNCWLTCRILRDILFNFLKMVELNSRECYNKINTNIGGLIWLRMNL